MEAKLQCCFICLAGMKITFSLGPLNFFKILCSMLSFNGIHCLKTSRPSIMSAEKMKAPKPFHLPFRFVTVCFSIKFKEKKFETRGLYFFWRRDENPKQNYSESKKVEGNRLQEWQGEGEIIVCKPEESKPNLSHKSWRIIWFLIEWKYNNL